jgi:ActR/RegA family two-component response regulator
VSSRDVERDGALPRRPRPEHFSRTGVSPAQQGDIMQDRSKILIVEDQAIVAYALRDEFVERGFDVAGVAATVAEALDIVSRGLPQVAVVDLHLGSERADVLAAALARSGVRVAVLSGDSEASNTLASVPHVFIPKPMDGGIVVEIAMACPVSAASSSATRH